MQLFQVVPKMPELVETFVDSTLLSVLISPSLYFFLYRPLSKQMSERLLIEKELRQSEADLQRKTQQLEETMQKLQQAPQLLLADKMSSLGRLVAGVAHEINNPVNFIYANLSYLDEYTQSMLTLIGSYRQRYPDTDSEITALIKEYDFEYLIKDLPKLLSSMQTGTERIQHIVLALRNFSRLDEAQVKTVNIHDGIDNTILLLQHQLKSQQEISDIQIIKQYGKLPNIECYPGLLNQVFMNVLCNAVDILGNYHPKSAISDSQNHPRLITIRTQMLNQTWVQISIQDNGPGNG